MRVPLKAGDLLGFEFGVQRLRFGVCNGSFRAYLGDQMAKP